MREDPSLVEGDEHDWDLVYETNAPRLRRYVARLVAPALVEDVLQETFLRAYKSRSSIDRSRPLAGWLAVVARRTSIDMLRHERVRTRAEQMAQECLPRPQTVEEALLNGLRWEAILQALHGLTEGQRQLLLAGELGAESADPSLSYEATKSRLARARRSFRQLYAHFSAHADVAGTAA